MRQHLDGFLEQALSDELAAGVEAHLNECDACWQELNELRNLFDELNDPGLQQLVLHEPAPLPADFTEQVMRRVEAERPSGVNLVWPWLRRRWSTRQYASVAYAMSATILVVSAGNLLYLWSATTDRLQLWSIQAQAYWDALQAHLGGTGAYLEGLWHNFLSLWTNG